MKRCATVALKGRRRRGFLLQDSLIGLVMVLALTMSFAVTVTQHVKGTVQLADRRTAVRLADNALLTLQSRPLTGVEIRRPNAPLTFTSLLSSPSSAYTWVQVTAQHHQAHATLTGLVPTSHLPQEVLK